MGVALKSLGGGAQQTVSVLVCILMIKTISRVVVGGGSCFFFQIFKFSVWDSFCREHWMCLEQMCRPLLTPTLYVYKYI